MQKAYECWVDNDATINNKKVFKEERGNLAIRRHFEDTVLKDGSAILMLVFRANYSEGCNFRDELCRGLIIVGVPYPNITDTKLLLK